MMLFGNRRGMSPVPLIIFIFLFLVTAVAAYVMQLKLEDLRVLKKHTQAAQLEPGQDVIMLKQEVADMEAALKKMENLAGYNAHGTESKNDILAWPIVESLNSVASLEKNSGGKWFSDLSPIDESQISKSTAPGITVQVAIERLDKAARGVSDEISELQRKVARIWGDRNVLNEDFPKYWDKWRQYRDKWDAETRRQAPRKEGFFAITSTYREVMKSNLDEIDKLVSEVDSARSEFEDLNRELFGDPETGERGSIEKAKDSLDENRRDLRVERVKLLTVEEEIIRTKNRYSKEIEKLVEKKKNLQPGAQIETGIRAYVQKLKNLRALRAEEREVLPDGEVVYANAEREVAYIDLARKNGVFRGMYFDVYRYKKGGQRLYKGRLRIEKVQDNLSIATILESKFELDPIGAGDILINKVYDRKKTPYFTFAGKLVGRYSNEEAAELIAELGGKVEPRVTSRTDYVVLGQGYESTENFQVAREVRIDTMTEKVLLQYLGKVK
jgi:hypothetical protein